MLSLAHLPSLDMRLSLVTTQIVVCVAILDQACVIQLIHKQEWRDHAQWNQIVVSLILISTSVWCWVYHIGYHSSSTIAKHARLVGQQYKGWPEEFRQMSGTVIFGLVIDRSVPVHSAQIISSWQNSTGMVDDSTRSPDSINQINWPLYWTF